jgi:hypothetical protein
MGLVVCGARLATSDSSGSRSSSGDVVLGVVGVVAGGLLPFVCVFLAWGVVSRRCYRLAQVPEAVAGRSRVVVWARSVLLPSYELDAEVYPVSKAFSTVVGRTRRPSCVWAGLPVIQPINMMLVAFAHGSLCNIMLIVTGVTMLLVCALCHVLFRPHRIVASNYLQGFAMALNAVVLFIASKLVGDPLNVAALDANSTIAMIQVALSVCRFVHTASYLVYMKLYGGKTLAVVSAADDDGLSDPLSPSAASPDTPITPVFDIRCTLTLLENDLDHEGGSRNGFFKKSDGEGSSTGISQTSSPSSAGPAGSTGSPTLPPSTSSPRTEFVADPAQKSSPSVSHKSMKIQQASIPTTKTPRPLRKDVESDDMNEPLLTVVQRPPKKETKKFIWNPKEYVPMERPYTFLYEEDFTPPEDDMNIPMEDLTASPPDDDAESSESLQLIDDGDDLDSPPLSDPPSEESISSTSSRPSHSGIGESIDTSEL